MIVLFCAPVALCGRASLTLDELRIILLLVPLIMIGAMAQDGSSSARHLDLSIGSNLGFSAMVTAMMFKFHPEIPWPLGFAVSIGVGAGLGLLERCSVTLFRLPAIIVTLGTLNLYRGLTGGPSRIDRQFVPSALKAMSQNSPTMRCRGLSSWPSASSS